MSDKQKRTQAVQANAFDFFCCRGQSRIHSDHMEGHYHTGMMSRMMEICRSVKSDTTAQPEESGTDDTIV